MYLQSHLPFTKSSRYVLPTCTHQHNYSVNRVCQLIVEYNVMIMTALISYLPVVED